MTGPAGEQQYYSSPGAQLRALREAAQLTINDVAQQLKLAPRQVVAIENDAVDELPGPTFVRGFIRNYARLLRVDAEPLLEAGNLIAPSSTPIEQVAPTMGEIPLGNGSGMSWTRWLIPLALILVLAAGIGYYEFGGVGTLSKKTRKDKADAEVVVMPPAMPAESIAAPATAVPASGSDPAPPAPAAPAPPVALPAAPAPPPEAPSAANAGASVAVAGQDQSRIDFELTQPSWIEVLNGREELLVSRILSAGKQSVTGAPPLKVRIGNASAVRLQFDGSPVDLAPYTKAEIARVTLPLRRP